uniref:Uncharacterized protein n=1 Tax=Nicotiana tabacum TaxID=4097 RepID=A0A1S4D354_TOBAC|nr:PREDICTED: uncharacterized protein LOC107825422 [Nicotiana tabacum]
MLPVATNCGIVKYTTNQTKKFQQAIFMDDKICCFGGGEGAEILRMDQGNRDAPPAIPHAEQAMGDLDLALRLGPAEPTGLAVPIADGPLLALDFKEYICSA